MGVLKRYDGDAGEIRSFETKFFNFSTCTIYLVFMYPGYDLFILRERGRRVFKKVPKFRFTPRCTEAVRIFFKKREKKQARKKI